MKKSHLILTTILILFIKFDSIAQIGLTKSEIIKEYGINYTVKKDNDGADIFSYSKDNQGRLIYFLKTRNGNEVCYQWKTLEQFDRINEFVKFFNKEYVTISKMRWKDYKTNTVYEVSSSKDKVMVIITAYLEP